MENQQDSSQNQPIPFRAETHQLLDILIHSLYTDRDVFLRELISNAADALTRINFEMLTNRNVLDPDVELGIWISVDPEQKLLVIRDTGVGMNQQELVENLGTIAHSGARAFLNAAQEGNAQLSDIIGQFGVGFYSAFMVAEWIRVSSRSYLPDSQAATWFCTGADTFTIQPAEKSERGTTVTIKLKEDAEEFSKEYRLKEIIKKHSDYIPFPIYLGEKKEQVNRQTSLWRQQPRQVEEQQYQDFYKQLTLDLEAPLTYTHLVIDAPVQMYAILYVPSTSERNILSLRKQDGLTLYARKVLIQEYNQDLLPEFFRFVVGVVDSEDIPLNISRESVQSSRVMNQLKKIISGKLIENLKTLAKEKPEEYLKFWRTYGRYIKGGIATDPEYFETLLPLLRFRTINHPEEWKSLDDYVTEMKEGQQRIYFILGDEEHSILNSPHLEVFKKLGYDVLLMTEPVDSFMLMRLDKFGDRILANASTEDLKLPKEQEESEAESASPLPVTDMQKMIERIKKQLGDKVVEVRSTDRLVESPARLVDEEGKINPQLQRVYKLLDQEYKVPQKILEINPRHIILKRLSGLPEDHPLNGPIIDQIYENALLIDGLHPDPGSMIKRIQQIMEAALKE